MPLYSASHQGQLFPSYTFVICVTIPSILTSLPLCSPRWPLFLLLDCHGALLTGLPVHILLSFPPVPPLPHFAG